MNKQMKWKLALTMMLAVMMVWLAACEPVGSTDLNQVLTDNLNRQSYEGDGTVTVKLITNDEARQLSDDKLYQLLGNEMTVRIDDMKMNNKTEFYIQGDFIYAQGEIGFEMYNEMDGLAIKLEGYDEPLIMNNAMLAEEAALAMMDFQQLQEQILDIQDELITVVGEYVIDRFPNPDTISIDEVETTVNGEEIQATQVHMEIPADAMFSLLQQFAINIAEDEEGLRELIGALYDIIIPVVKEHAGEELEADPMAAALIDNREFVVEMVFTSLQQGLASFTTEVESGLEEVASATHSDTMLTLDYYLDEDNQIRKSEMNLLLKPVGVEDEPITAMEITSTEQYWNINGDVAVPTMSIEDGIEIYDMGNEYEFMKHVDQSSDLYELLHATGATEKEVLLFIEDSPYMMNAYMEDGTSYVPVRYVSEQLYGDVKWNHERKEIMIIDHPTGNEVVITIGSDVATVNNESFTWSKQPLLIDNTLFVPVRDFADMLEVEWTFNKGLQYVELTRHF